MRDVNAWVLGILGAPVALVAGSVAHVVMSGTDGLFSMLLWNCVLAVLVLMASIVVSPIPFLIAERLGIAASSKRKFWWSTLVLAPSFAALFLFAQSRASVLLDVTAGIAGVLLNLAVFGAVYARSHPSIQTDALKRAADF